MTSRAGAVELLVGKLYYVTLISGPTESSKQAAHFWSADEFSYWNFFLDFGPLSLGNLFRFCRTLNFKLKSERLQGKAIYIYSGPHAHKRTNAAFLLSAWLMMYDGRTPEQAFEPFQDAFPPFPPFHDASPCVCTFDLTIPQCLSGLLKASRFGFFDFNTFDVEEYEHYEQVENGDLNWLVDGKFLAFAGPHNRSEMTREGYRTLTPRNYIPYFKKNNVTLVVRLNKKYYDERLFLDAGIDHLEAYFPDGSVPPPNIVRQFIAACEATPGAVAVHCKAGLGRTGTCIGCYIMKHYSFSAAEVIGWMRVCRPGSVIGAQQHYLERMEGPMHREGFAFRQRAGHFSSPRRAHADLSPRRKVQGEPRFERKIDRRGPGVTVEHSRGSADIGRYPKGDFESGLKPPGGSRSFAAASGKSNAQAPRPFVSSLGAFGRVNEKGHASKKEEPSPRCPSLQADRRNNTSTRRKSTGSDRSQQHWDGVERVSRTLRQLDVDRHDRGKGQGGAGGRGAHGRTASTHRDRHRQAVNTGSRRASVPPGGAGGRFAEERSAAAGPAGKHVPSAISSPAGAPNRTTLDVWEEAAAAADGGRWALGGRTQGDYLLQQRARR